jgi:hypothetical protein
MCLLWSTNSGFISRKTVFLKVITVKTSNPTFAFWWRWIRDSCSSCSSELRGLRRRLKVLISCWNPEIVQRVLLLWSFNEVVLSYSLYAWVSMWSPPPPPTAIRTGYHLARLTVQTMQLKVCYVRSQEIAGLPALWTKVICHIKLIFNLFNNGFLITPIVLN